MVNNLVYMRQFLGRGGILTTSMTEWIALKSLTKREGRAYMVKALGI